jgi:hypothetical protein
MLSPAKREDVSPSKVWKWTKWKDEFGKIHNVPPYAKVISRGSELKKKHYALVCRSDSPLVEADGENFDPYLCRTLQDKIPGSSQVTALLTGHHSGHKNGSYKIAFRATLVAPWAPELCEPVMVR